MILSGAECFRASVGAVQSRNLGQQVFKHSCWPFPWPDRAACKILFSVYAFQKSRGSVVCENIPKRSHYFNKLALAVSEIFIFLIYKLSMQLVPTFPWKQSHHWEKVGFWNKIANHQCVSRARDRQAEKSRPMNEKQLSIPMDIAIRWLPAPTTDSGCNSSSILVRGAAIIIDGTMNHLFHSILKGQLRKWAICGIALISHTLHGRSNNFLSSW